jgi:putative transposase
MRYSQAEKMEIIHLFEHSRLSIRKTLEELAVPRSSFYRWYQKYQLGGYEGLADKKPRARHIWNRIPEEIKEQVVDHALSNPEKSCRQLAWEFVDLEGYFLSESSVYRILKGHDLVQSPMFQMIGAKEKFEKPIRFVHELCPGPDYQLRVVLPIHSSG